MKTNKTVIFLLKKLLISLPIAILGILLVFEEKFTIISGFLLGVTICIMKVVLVGYFISKTKTIKKTKLYPIKIALLFTLFMTIIIGISLLIFTKGVIFFLSFASGLLLLNIVIFLNSVTEALMITKNNFE